MKTLPITSFLVCLYLCSCATNENDKDRSEASFLNAYKVSQPYFLDVHDLEPGKISYEDALKAYERNLETQINYDVNFHKFWIDEEKGKVYYLSQADNETSVKQTHKVANGKIPSEIYQVNQGLSNYAAGDGPLYIDFYHVGEDKITTQEVEDAHLKSLNIQEKYGVTFINYWVDEKKGVVMWLSKASDANAVRLAHKEAHGLQPDHVLQVKQGG